jgi:ParB family chromosome partitioning protein
MSGSVTSTSKNLERPAAALETQRQLSEHLQTRVRVEMGKRKGRIVLDFVSLEELERIRKVITGEAEGSSVTTASPG